MSVRVCVLLASFPESVLRPPATMICLFLSIFAYIFQSGWTGVNERTFIAVKPDGVQRRLVGEIVRRFEKRGFKLVGLKLMQASEDLLREHYCELRSKPFFSRLMTYMSSGPVVAMVWQGLDVVKTARKMLGETNPAESLPGTIRGDFCVETGRNVIHGSDSVESAQKEISLWFRQNELQCWEDSSSRWIYN
ncbi:nucleoside diphosphate kinase 3 isoform X1 [Lates calcarifer]|uniref:Nucleoside diphosphate kinase n=1 Tax=Lates calcarifer TaxID=8187 RepID=A0A4W6BSV3_LATCA|nr:nucleoside diphosphate kinase 3 isoform X1 [Lates calcarifer]